MKLRLERFAPPPCFSQGWIRKEEKIGLTAIWARVSMAEAQEITETMKATDQMAWIGKMNNIRVSAMEAVDKELIYV